MFYNNLIKFYRNLTKFFRFRRRCAHSTVSRCSAPVVTDPESHLLGGLWPIPNHFVAHIAIQRRGQRGVRGRRHTADDNLQKIVRSAVFKCSLRMQFKTAVFSYSRRLFFKTAVCSCNLRRKYSELQFTAAVLQPVSCRLLKLVFSSTNFIFKKKTNI